MNTLRSLSKALVSMLAAFSLFFSATCCFSARSHSFHASLFTGRARNGSHLPSGLLSFMAVHPAESSSRSVKKGTTSMPFFVRSSPTREARLIERVTSDAVPARRMPLYLSLMPVRVERDPSLSSTGSSPICFLMPDFSEILSIDSLPRRSSQIHNPTPVATTPKLMSVFGTVSDSGCTPSMPDRAAAILEPLINIPMEAEPAAAM
mmetsp:Transcript_13004/g.31896  ORF Transcript_13004/g.31896 Transcript_13004/m.31896 type:complete len:206 (+) Transcript_13004:178-795(+)